MSLVGALFGGSGNGGASQPTQPQQQPVTETSETSGSTSGSTMSDGQTTGSSSSGSQSQSNTDGSSTSDQSAQSQESSASSQQASSQTTAQSISKARRYLQSTQAAPAQTQSVPVGSEFGNLVVSATLSGSDSVSITSLFEPLSLEISDEEKTKNILDILHRLEGDDRQVAEEMSAKISELKKSA